MVEKTLGMRIREAREKRHWSRETLGEKLRVTSETVLRWELKGALPRYDTQLELIKMFGLHEQDFQQMQRIQKEEASSSSTEALVPDPKTSSGKEETLATSVKLIGESMSDPDVEPLHSSKDDFKLYRGWRPYKREGKGIVIRFPYVTVNGRPLRYFGPFKRDPEQNRLFEWGYNGSGPGQLAESILADFFGEVYPEKGYASRKDFHALIYGDAFKYEVIIAFPRGDDDAWELTSSQIRNWLLSLKERGITEKDLLEKSFVYDSETGLIKADDETH